MILFESISELQRRAEIINKARQNAVMQITKVDDIIEPFFWHIEFFVSISKNKDDYPRNTTTIMPNKDTDITDKRKKAPRRIHQIFLDNFDGSLFIRLSKVGGSITHHMIFESGKNTIPSTK